MAVAHSYCYELLVTVSGVYIPGTKFCKQTTVLSTNLVTLNECNWPACATLPTWLLNVDHTTSCRHMPRDGGYYVVNRLSSRH